MRLRDRINMMCSSIIIVVLVLGLTTKGYTQASCASYGSATPPPPYDACVQAVFDADAFCCNTTWDALCQGIYDPVPCAGGGGGGLIIDMPPTGSLLGCGASFFDSGGSAGSYLNSENNVVTLCPASSADRIQITFSSFNIESGFDFLTVYDGTTTAATPLGTFTGSTIPPVLTATNGTGCLTFEFTSDGSVTSTGWSSSIACVPPGSGGGGGPVVASDCAVAANVCTNLSFSVDPSGFGVIDELSLNNISNPTLNPNGTNTGCLLSGELHSTWMIVNVASTGSMQFSFGTDGGSNCYDWIMWQYTPTTCANIMNNTLPPVACNWNGGCESFTGMASPLPTGGDPTNFEAPLNVNCGEQYLICFSNFSSALTSVPLNFFGTASVACGVFNPVTVNSPTVCVGQCAALTATGASTYSWAVSPDLAGTTGANNTACPGAPGTFTYAVTGTGSCGTNSTSATVTVLPSSDPSCILLNTKLREFKGFLNARQEVELLWQTESEDDTDWFVVEKSFNGTDFSDFQKLKAGGTTNYVLNYSSLDPSPSPIVTYYRLRLIHKNGVIVYSNVIAIEGKEGFGGISIYPNPADQQLILVGSNLEHANFSLMNALGQSFSIQPSTANNQKAAFDISQFSPGVYYIVVSVDGITKTEKLLIE